ncbi:tellurite resistance TerB family protein [Thiohalocapsa marina]|uniref:tellurite resistance TerB family protein n=1 Tax=Thiohalocapsa marina TaxID=424902 RepID=UPI001478220A|nr:tellurite resistance TerB family protein [Thiohalocapsa marina]
MFDSKRLLDELVGSGAAGGFAGGLAGGALASLLTSKKPGKQAKKLAGSAIKVGGLALVGGLAYKAWQNYQKGAKATPEEALQPPPSDSGFLPAAADAQAGAVLSLLLAKAMIAAAKADGQIDTAESQAILEQINGLDLPAEDKAFLFEEYGRPLDIAALAAEVRTPEHAAEVYTASAWMLDPPSPPERFYLDTLGRALGLDPALAQQIEATVAASGAE